MAILTNMTHCFNTVLVKNTGRGQSSASGILGLSSSRIGRKARVTIETCFAPTHIALALESRTTATPSMELKLFAGSKIAKLQQKKSFSPQTKTNVKVGSHESNFQPAHF